MTTTTEETETMETTIVGWDITENANVPKAVCFECNDGTGVAIHRGEEWGADAPLRCDDCGDEIDVTLVATRHDA